MKAQIKIIIYAVVAVLFATVLALYIGSAKHVKTLKTQLKSQSVIIDSLLTRRMTVVDVQLHVTDKSKNVVHGRYNKGTISMPQERIYKLEIDSTNILIN